MIDMQTHSNQQDSHDSYTEGDLRDKQPADLWPLHEPV